MADDNNNVQQGRFRVTGQGIQIQSFEVPGSKRDTPVFEKGNQEESQPISSTTAAYTAALQATSP